MTPASQADKMLCSQLYVTIGMIQINKYTNTEIVPI